MATPAPATAIRTSHTAAPIDRAWVRLLLVLASVGLLTLAFAPVGQFYLAYVGLVPWLVVVGRARRARSAFLWSWLGGTLFFFVNMWWLYYVTGPGMLALMLYLGLYWGVVALALRGVRLLDGDGHPSRFAWTRVPRNLLLAAAVWVASEWARGVIFTGLPWLYIGHTQTPFLPACQIADTLGVYGVSFGVVLINALVAFALLHREARQWLAAAVMVLILWAANLGYGVYRMGQQTTRPGPTVLVVQPVVPQNNSGEKGAPRRELLDFHVDQTEAGLRQNQAVDLAVWSETMMPPLNAEARELLPESIVRDFTPAYRRSLQDAWRIDCQDLIDADTEIKRLAGQYHVALLIGGEYSSGLFIRRDDKDADKIWVSSSDKRNTAYLYTPDGRQSPLRYDKIHLVPFGEYTPFKDSANWFYRFFLWFNPYPHPEDMDLRAGTESQMTVFPLPIQKASAPAYRFVVPICFEDIDAALVGKMFRPDAAVAGNGKRADFIVNITNDGWFRANEMPQHLQAAVFRSIENRVPTARSVNNGVSGFVDPVGRTSGLIPAAVPGSSAGRLVLDSRLTLYTQFGDVFAVACTVVAAVLSLLGAATWWRGRRSRVNDPPI